MQRNLMHPDMSYVKYLYYMGKITGESAYRAEVDRRMNLFLGDRFADVGLPNGTRGMAFSHRSFSGGYECQNNVYSRDTISYLIDLHLDGYSKVTSDILTKLANTFKTVVIISEDNPSLKGDFCGGKTLGKFSPGPNATLEHGSVIQSTYFALARWDSSGKIRRWTENTFRQKEGRPDSPMNVHAPAGMVLLLAQ
jgi:hypothetical protein